MTTGHKLVITMSQGDPIVKLYDRKLTEEEIDRIGEVFTESLEEGLMRVSFEGNQIAYLNPHHIVSMELTEETLWS